MSEPDIVEDFSSASALYNVLSALKNSGVSNMELAWQQVLDVKKDTLEFAQRHSEIVALWSDTLEHINALTSMRTKKLMLRHAYSWWSAIIRPGLQWENQNSNPKSIDENDLDQLASLSEIISARLGGTSASPNSQDLSLAREYCEELVSLLRDTEEISDEPLRQTLLAQAAHLVWLIDHAELLGVSRVIIHGDQLTGALIRASHQQGVKIKNPEKLKRLIIQLVAALAVIAGVARNSETVIDAAKDSVPAIERIVHDITESNSVSRVDDGGSHKG